MRRIKEKKYTMMSGVLKYSFLIIFAFALIMPFVVVNGAGATDSFGKGVTIDAKISNPLNSKYDTIPKFIEAIVNIVLIVGIPILVLAFIYTGFMYVKAQGNPGELEVAHRRLLYTVIGAALLLGAFVIAKAIGETVKNIGNNA